MSAGNPILPMIAIRPAIFSPFVNVVAGMSTRQGGVSPDPLGMNMSYSIGDDVANVRRNREIFFTHLAIDPERVAYTNQVHGDTIVEVDRPGRYQFSDALVTQRTNIFLSVSVADCVPILLYDSGAKVVAAVHSGWRGSRVRVLEKTVTLMRTAYLTEPEQLYAFIGPSASECCYEVGEEVASQFPASYVVRDAGAKRRLNLKKYNVDMLLEAGLQVQQIQVSEDCTICQTDTYHSYRRDRERSGRMMACIGLSPGNAPGT